ncbi:uncharacterized protein B0J16DRAFT_336069 [Fusarium flagelliforme]|uniref:uncharacterized protein n=1 Tax=Fusarium flagelliforme TaxID=2675880 RepID=UPI001E8E3D63|nr:uncharacterized protein B0J16DRAFT_336069 [Fusarium flagelliforme]KAH7193828.1 hypothetical protein B0J16DRAFT_336069 [Fusarium flagelliforme]
MGNQPNKRCVAQKAVVEQLTSSVAMIELPFVAKANQLTFESPMRFHIYMVSIYQERGGTIPPGHCHICLTPTMYGSACPTCAKKCRRKVTPLPKLDQRLHRSAEGLDVSEGSRGSYPIPQELSLRNHEGKWKQNLNRCSSEPQKTRRCSVAGCSLTLVTPIKWHHHLFMLPLREAPSPFSIYRGAFLQLPDFHKESLNRA